MDNEEREPDVFKKVRYWILDMAAEQNLPSDDKITKQMVLLDSAVDLSEELRKERRRLICALEALTDKRGLHI